ncbi:uncharacterized protein B0P05DRAFT_558442 [Gilbertella persicaria]|uniref:uncharacterized protein n=1 Tax=Gilbertella persicaria TaxID=101096 RepID=UPI00221E9F77|nr:uncharacterized protein B0P05DRAFT_558442 [Gilbertella persicaria]KAI8059394.1 hypothetical protein B0P05DRAFT_558442 [Gilbertella persicaria]
MPSRESLYQLTRSLYKSSHLHGLYAIHDTLLSRLHHQKPSKRSNRSKRTLLYLNTMLINLMGSYTRPVDMVRIKALCKELNQFQCSNQSPIVLYNTLIKIMLQQQQTASAHALLDDLYARHLQPTMQTYGILMKDAAMRKDKSRLLSYLDQIDKNPDLGIDYATVSIVVGALCRCRAFDRAVHVVKALHLPRTKDEISSPKYTQHLLEWIEKRKQYSQKKNRKKKKKDIKRK